MGLLKSRILPAPEILKEAWCIFISLIDELPASTLRQHKMGRLGRCNMFRSLESSQNKD